MRLTFNENSKREEIKSETCKSASQRSRDNNGNNIKVMIEKKFRLVSSANE